MEDQAAFHGAEFGGFDEFAVGDADGVEFGVEFGAPEVEEFVEHGKLRGDVEQLPDELLQDGRMVGQMVEDLGSFQTNPPIVLPDSNVYAPELFRII